MRQLSAVVGSSHRYIPPDRGSSLHSTLVVTSVLDGIHGVHGSLFGIKPLYLVDR